MSQGTTSEQFVIGLDLGDRRTEAAVVDAAAELVETRRLRTSPGTFLDSFAEYPGSVVVMEVGSVSPWVSRIFQDRGFEVVVANAARVQAIAKNHRKTDRGDAEMLARIGRLDRELLSPITHRGPRAQAHLAMIRQRDGLVRGRTKHINEVRGFCNAQGHALPRCEPETFVKRARQTFTEAPYPGFWETLTVVECLSTQVAALDRKLEVLCEQQYPEAKHLRQIRGVGPVTALCFVLTLEDARRFRKSRSVGEFLGLCPRQRESGDSAPQLGISKTGDELLRRLLIGCGHYIIGPFGEDSDLRRFGLRRSELGGKAARKRAAVAVARKLAVIMHRMWITGEDYEPLRNAARG